MSTPPGWYPDPAAPNRQRYFDGRKWAPDEGDFATGEIPVVRASGTGGIPVAARSGMSAGVKALLWIAGAFVVLGGVAGTVVLVTSGGALFGAGPDPRPMVIDEWVLADVTCDSLADKMVDQFSKPSAERTGDPLVLVSMTTLRADKRSTFTVPAWDKKSDPAGDKKSEILSCTGTGLWKDSKLLNYTRKVNYSLSVAADGHARTKYASVQ